MEETRDRVLMLAVRAGELLLRNGAEVERVEGAVITVSRSFGFPYAECFTTTTGIFLSLGEDITATKEQDVTGSVPVQAAAARVGQNFGTVIKRVFSISTNFQIVSEVNALVRCLAAGKLTLDQGIAKLDEIERTDHFIWPLRIAAVMLVAAFFTLMNKGAPLDVVSALFSGTVAWLVSMGIERLRINRFIAIFSGSFVAAALALLFFNLGIGSSLSSVIIGAITMFLPGVALTNATRDMVAGDLLSGTSRIVESMLIATAIALGVGLLLRIAPSPLHPDVLTEFTLLPQAAFAVFGTIGVCVAFNSPRRLIAVTALIGACGWTLYEMLRFAGESRLIACFASACLVAFLAECTVRVTREPFTLFVIPAIWPLVPGSSMYSAMMRLLEGNYNESLLIGVEALLIAGSIACALLVITSLFRIVSRLYARYFKKTLP